MKKVIALILAFALAALVLAACGGSASSTPPLTPPSDASSQPAPPQSTPPAESTPATESTPAATSIPATMDLDAALATMVEAAELGDTIEMTDIDLMAAGVNTDNVLAFAGAQSKLVAQNGGQVIIIQAAPGTAEAVADELVAYRDALVGNDDYAEFEDARDHIENASTVTTYSQLGIVVWAVAANGNATAITEAMQQLYGAG